MYLSSRVGGRGSGASKAHKQATINELYEILPTLRQKKELQAFEKIEGNES